MSFDTLSLNIPVPCVQGYSGDRLATYTTQVPPQQIVALLGHDPRSKNWKRLQPELRDIYAYLQRKTAKSRRESVAGYIEERLGPDPMYIGAFPAISIAHQNPAQFVPYENQKAVGNLLIDASPSNYRVLVDGLARVTGALDLAEESFQFNFSFPVTIYAPRPGEDSMSLGEMGQLFHDFNFRVQPVQRQHAIALDRSDPYILLANKLGQAPFIKENGGVAQRAASLGKKSTELVVQTVLVRTVRGACEGRRFQESNLATTDEPNLSRDTFRSVLDALEAYFTGIADRMGNRFVDRTSVHLTSPGWQALGVIFHDIHFRLNLSPLEWGELLDRIASIDWSRHNQDWLAMGIAHKEVDKLTGEHYLDSEERPRLTLTGSGRTNTQKLIDYCRSKTGLTEQLEAQYTSEEAELAQPSG